MFFAVLGVSQLVVEDVAKGQNDRPKEDVIIVDCGEVCATPLGCLTTDIPVPSSPSM